MRVRASVTSALRLCLLNDLRTYFAHPRIGAGFHEVRGIEKQVTSVKSGAYPSPPWYGMALAADCGSICAVVSPAAGTAPSCSRCYILISTLSAFIHE